MPGAFAMSDPDRAWISRMPVPTLQSVVVTTVTYGMSGERPYVRTIWCRFS